MRTSLTVDKVLAAAHALSVRMAGSLGSAVSGLARRACRGASTNRVGRDPTVFAVPHDTETLTGEDVKRALAEFP